MSAEDSLEERQNNELVALQGIYGDQLKDLRQKRAWNRWCPLDLSVTLYAQCRNSDIEEKGEVDLHVVCSERYPNELPQLTLENPKGLPQTSLRQMEKELYAKALEHQGTEMIYELCTRVEDLIPKYYKHTMSFYDEMLLAQQEKEKKAELKKQSEAKRLREITMREVQEREELLKAEYKLRKRRQKSWSETESEDQNGGRRTSVSHRKLHNNSDHNENPSCEHKGTFKLDFGGRTVQRGQCLRHGESTSIIFTGIDTTTGELLEVAEWTITKKPNEDGQLQKLVSSIEQELNYLVTLKHVNLAQYFGFKHEVVDGKRVVYVLKEMIVGSNCHSLFTSKNLKIDISFLKHLAKGVLNALDYIHRNNAVHKDLKDTCIYVNEKGVVKVSDYSIRRRLLDLISSTHGTYNKKTDIYDFGQLVLRLLGYSSFPETPSELPRDLRDLLLHCLNKDEKERYTANQLLNHSFFQEPLVHFTTEQNERNDHPIERILSPEEVPLPMSIPGEGQSRINTEFQLLVYLGKGAFGDVIKAKNKLDGGYYAIKRIRLVGYKKEANKRKIVREVTLLSKLNHENIVRYYGSWIETETIKPGENETDSSMTATETTEPSKQVQLKKDDFTLNDNIEEMAPSRQNVEISVTYDSKSQAAYDESYEDDSSSDEDDFKAPPENNKFAADSESDGIEFERGTSTEAKSAHGASANAAEDSERTKNIVCKKDYLYIQMEFCEKSTLLNAIANDLYKERNRVWRLFREIVEGLAYIHQQGIIHRDLKPVNIFLASNDHVKIGDFGLATKIRIRTPQIETMGVSRANGESVKEDLGDESITKQVGTPLYVAPEIDSTSEAFYTEKVDIYSLGIIFFEMCYRPLTTAMEKSIILGKLRSKDIVFPDDFPDDSQTAHLVIKWLLNHDISKRPSSQELLQSKHLPPPVLEEQELQEFVHHALSNPSSKAYRHLISSCFQQTITLAQDITYDRDPTNPIVSKPPNVYEYVREVCVRYFKQHGARNLATPLLMPRTQYYDGVESCVNLMTHFGNIVSLPHDLRVPFARYVAWNNVNNLRRYSVERVYKEKKVFGFLPREFYECAFDIVTPEKGTLVVDAEILCVVHEIVTELPGFKNRNFQIRLNHTDLFDAILSYCGVIDKKDDLLNLLQEIKEGKVPKFQLQNFLIQKGLSDVTITFLIGCLQSDVEMCEATSHFQNVLKKRTGDVGDKAKLALQDLKVISQNAECYGVEFEFVIAPGLVYNIKQYSGMICQFVCDVKKKKHPEPIKEVVAVGGRYDAMITYYRTIMEQTNMPMKNLQQSAVGVSISLDRLAQGVHKADKKTLPKMDALDIIVCSVGPQQMISEKAKILRSLWEAGVKCALIEEANIVDIQEYLMERGVSYAIILNEAEQGFVRMRSWERDSKEGNFDKFQERVYAITELVENVQKILKLRHESSNDNSQSGGNLTRSESKSSYTEKNDEGMVDVLFVTQDKLHSNARKRYETQVRSHLEDLFKRLSGHIIVIAVNIEIGIVRYLASFLELNNETVFNKSVQFCVDKFPKITPLLNEICEVIWKMRTKKTNPTVVLFSLTDNKYKVIM